jgi:hypothetical protein
LVGSTALSAPIDPEDLREDRATLEAAGIKRWQGLDEGGVIRTRQSPLTAQGGQDADAR